MKALKDAQKRTALKGSTISGGAAKVRSSSGSGAKKTPSGGKKKAAHDNSEEITFQPIRDVIDAGQIVRELGDHINTRYVDHDDLNTLDAGLGLNYDEEGMALIDEARKAAGDRRQAVMAEVKSHLFGKNYNFNALAAGLTDATLSHQSPNSQTSPPNMDKKIAFVGHNRNTVTCCAILDMTIFYGDKTGHVFRAEPNATFSRSSSALSSSVHQPEYFYHRIPMNPHHKGAVLSLAVSDTRGNRPANWGKERSSVDMSVLNYLVSGGQDGAIHVWKAVSGDYVGILKMHRSPVTGLAFRQWSSMLVSSSADTTIRLWSVPEMHCEDKFFGHNGPVNGVSSLRKERCATAGADRTVRHWKLDAATQVEFSTDGSPAECVAMVDDVHIVAGTADGKLMLFDTNKRYPLQTIEQPHGSGFVGDGTGLEMLEGSPSPLAAARGNAITAIAALPYGDMVATGSYSGVVALWHFAGSAATNMNAAARAGNREKDAAAASASGEGAARPTNRLSLVATFTAKGCVNTLQFSPDGSVLIAAIGKDQRMGRWLTVASALNGVMVIPLRKKGEEEVSGVTATTQVTAYRSGDNILDGVDGDALPRRILRPLVQDPAHQPLTEEAKLEARRKKRKELLERRKAAREAAKKKREREENDDDEDEDGDDEEEGDAIDNWKGVDGKATPAATKATTTTNKKKNTTATTSEAEQEEAQSKKKKKKTAASATKVVVPSIVPQNEEEEDDFCNGDDDDRSDKDMDDLSVDDDNDDLGAAPAFKLGKDGQFVFDDSDDDNNDNDAAGGGGGDDEEDLIVKGLKKGSGASQSKTKSKKLKKQSNESSSSVASLPSRPSKPSEPQLKKGNSTMKKRKVEGKKK